jgi:hypothetical protein
LPLVEKQNILIGKILEMINSILAEVDIENIVKNHKFNKKVFNLYWNLYAIESLISQDFNILSNFLKSLDHHQKQTTTQSEKEQQESSPNSKKQF